ncbi:hypothetical protein ASE55_17930 [Chryseobacterium sp. Leaf201]|nr:hypothetical protein ASE55_17930 [Chryseobacterium sp. Leaf201]
MCKDDFSDLIKAEIEAFYKVSITDRTGEKQLVYILSHRLSGMYTKKLYISFFSGKVINYRISYFILNIKIF